MTEQHSDERTTIEPKSLHNNVILLHALYNLPVGPLMKNTYYIGGNLVFPLSCHRHANSLYRNYKRGRLPNQTYSIQTTIATLLEEFDSVISRVVYQSYTSHFSGIGIIPPPLVGIIGICWLVLLFYLWLVFWLVLPCKPFLPRLFFKVDST